MYRHARDLEFEEAAKLRDSGRGVGPSGCAVKPGGSRPLDPRKGKRQKDIALEGPGEAKAVEEVTAVRAVPGAGGGKQPLRVAVPRAAPKHPPIAGLTIDPDAPIVATVGPGMGVESSLGSEATVPAGGARTPVCPAEGAGSTS